MTDATTHAETLVRDDIAKVGKSLFDRGLTFQDGPGPPADFRIFRHRRFR